MMKNLVSSSRLVDIYHRGGVACQWEPLSALLTMEDKRVTFASGYTSWSPNGDDLKGVGGNGLDTFQWILKLLLLNFKGWQYS